MYRVKLFFASLAGLLIVSCQGDVDLDQLNNDYSDPTMVSGMFSSLTDAVVYDIFSPPAASRVYAYVSMAVYESIEAYNPDLVELCGKLNESRPKPMAKPEQAFIPLVALEAFNRAAKHFVFSEDKIDAYYQEKVAELQDLGVPKSVWEESKNYGIAVANMVIDYSSTDGYAETRALKYTVKHDPGEWLPTPPDYMDAIEPNWNQLRAFIIDSATQFIPVPPTSFDSKKNSLFYKEMMEVYETTNQLDDEQIAIAKFWDCNPFVTLHQGHYMQGLKKITPGGHWVGIAGIASKTAASDFYKTIQSYTLTCLTLADAFISCWDEKYRSRLIRPETVINAYVDPDWRPLLTTPPFPEYTSGHSVISAAAATTLTYLYGEEFSYADTVEVKYGLDARNFGSFREASEEAAISRLYGGIHYMPAINNGVDQGKKVGGYIVEQLKKWNEE